MSSFLERGQCSSPPRCQENGLGNCGCRFHPQVVGKMREEESGPTGGRGSTGQTVTWTSLISLRSLFRKSLELDLVNQALFYFILFYVIAKLLRTFPSFDETAQSLE